MIQSPEFVGGTVLDDLPAYDTLPRGADTYHDFRPAWAVRVMRAVSTPRKTGKRDVCPSGVAEIFPGVHKEYRCCARCNGLGYSVQQVVE